jgi:hypothetical protein
MEKVGCVYVENLFCDLLSFVKYVILVGEKNKIKLATSFKKAAKIY